MHRSWLELVDSDGPFLAIPALKRVWPNGIPDFRANHPDRFAALVDAKKSFEQAWERADQYPDDDKALSDYRNARDSWVQTVLQEVMGWQDSLVWGETAGIQAQSPNHNVTITPKAVLSDLKGNKAALVYVIDPVESLRETPNDGWAATQIDRVEELLRAADVPVGIVTDGRWWGLVSYKNGTMPASGVVDSLTWIEEPRTRDAFLTILGRQYLIGGDSNERLPVLFEESIAAAEEITEALGVQVRSAVELLVQAFSESALEAERRGLPDPLPERSRDVYEAAVTIMMRTVFLLFAEERGMLPAGELFEQSYGLVGRLERLSRREAEEGEEALDTTSMTWHRLLATSTAIYSGATFENLRMPAYGGSLFDPARFSWLTETTDEGMLAITVSDRVMLHVLRSVQLAQLKGGEARQISFRDIDVEQIGYIYEGLLGYTATRVNETYVGLKGAAGAEPEIPLATLEKLHQENPDPKKFASELQEWVSKDQPAAKSQSAAAMIKGLNAEIDPSLVSALSQSVGGNIELRDRIKPFLGIIRQDLRSHPFVVLPGGLLLKETPSRKNAGAHYTPKSLAEEVVLHALQPLCYSPGPHQTGNESEWKLRPSEEILNLKVADIACGSGAFLVAAARYLADRVVEAWIAEDPGNSHRKDLHLRAIRQVVANCLYGADINDMAVEMAKLSLWLVSLDRDLPFSFVDDKIFLGNSLLGLTSLDQLRALHIDPANASGQDVLSDVNVDVDAVIRKAIELRERLASEIDEDDPMRSTTAKRRQYEQFQAVTKELRLLADGVIAAGLPLGGKPGNTLNEAFQNLRLAVKKAQPQQVGGEGDSSWLHSIIDKGLTPTVETDYEQWTPIHWVFEAPDVIIDHDGFDAVIGNPPFLGSQKLNSAIGGNFRDWLVRVLAFDVKGIADLVAYFLLRSFSLLAPGGNLGLVATNTIAQGDTREVGLGQLVDSGFTITRSIQSRPWPASSANLEYAAVWGTREAVDSRVARYSNGKKVAQISSLLEAEGDVQGNPKVLKENSGLAFNGIYVLGMGFVVEPERAVEWIAVDERLQAVVRPYLNGKDLNNDPQQRASRYVIDFNDMSLDEAKSFELAFARVDRDVRPERQRRRNNGKYVLSSPLPEKWWLHARSRPAMRKAIAPLERVIAIAQVSATLMPTFVKADQVLDAKLVVFALDSHADLALLSSEPHRLWALKYGTTMRTDASYTPSTIFDPFPRPLSTESMNAAGRALDETRREILIRRDLGLTKFYNLVNDSSVRDEVDEDVATVRELHHKVDVAVADAYGWNDIDLEHGFHEYRGSIRWSVAPLARAEILDRLLEENHRRAELEDKSDAKSKNAGKRKSSVEQGEALF
jgi:hypothetical protein